jgi:hypothetical protein
VLPQPWGDLIDGLSHEFPLVERKAAWLCFGWPSDKPEQTVQVNCLRANQLMRVIVTADICAADLVSARAALELGAHLLFGAMIVRRGVLSLRHIYTEGRFTRAQLREAIVLLRDNALLVRARLEELKASVAGTAYDAFKY